MNARRSRRDARRRRLRDRWLAVRTQRFECACSGEAESADSCALQRLPRDGCAVVCDGVSRSHVPGAWARALAMRLVGSTETMSAELARSLSTAMPVAGALDWDVAQLARRGSHATALRARWHWSQNMWSVDLESVGDCLFVCDGGDRRDELMTWPFRSVGEMPHAPSVLSSVEPNLRGQCAARQLHVPSTSATRLLLMTDALARFFLAARGSVDDRLPFLCETADFNGWVRDKRSAELLEDDDITLVVVDLPRIT